MQRTLASLTLFLAAAPLWAQIELPAEHQLGRRIVASTPFEAKVYDWSCPTADVLGEGGKAFIWAPAGKHTITLIAVTEQFELKRWSQDFEVTSDPVPPTPATLRELVSDAEAKKIAEYLRALAGQVSKIADASQFWSVWQQTFPVQGNAKLDAALKARLDPAIEAKKGLSTVLVAIADEFEKDTPKPPTPPTPTPVTEGKRQVVIAHESENDNPDFSSLIVSLRKPGGPADAYLKSHSHGLEILDDDLIRESDNKWNSLLSGRLDQLPRLFVIDPQTNAILFEQVIANGTTADNIIERIRETGG